MAVAGVYIIANHRRRKIDVRHSINCLESISKQLSRIQDGTHEIKELIEDQNDLMIEILEKTSEYRERLLRHTFWLDFYKECKYEFYYLRSGLRYKVRIDVENYEVRVKLQNQNHDSIIVGYFQSMDEAHEFVEKHYETPIYKIIYASNELTERYLSKQQSC